MAHISGKHYVGISRGWRELEAKSEEKFKSWVTLKVMKKISAWVFQNWTSVSGFTEGLGKEGTQCNIQIMYQKSTLKACKISLTNVTPINLIKSSERKEGTTSISPREVKNKVGQGLKLQRSRLKFYFSDKVSADNVGV